MIKDVQSSAAALYDGGWRAADKEDLIEEYELTADEAAEICELLQEYEEKDTWGEIESYVNAHTDEVVEACKKAEVEAYENANGLDVLVFAEIEDGELVLDSTCDYKDISQDLPKYIIYRAFGQTESDVEDFLYNWDGTIEEAIDGCMSENDFLDKIYDLIEDGKK